MTHTVSGGNVAWGLCFWQYKVCADIRGVHWRGGVKRQWGVGNGDFLWFRWLLAIASEYRDKANSTT